MVRFELTKDYENAIPRGPKSHPIAVEDEPYFAPLKDYIVMLGDYYLRYERANNIDNWITLIDRQIFAKDNQEYFGDNVCVFFEGDKVKLINYWDYEAGSREYCEITVEELIKVTFDWKWFVISWEIKKIKGEM